MSEHPRSDTRSHGEDRRDSPRVPIRLLVRDESAGGSFEEREGNLALGGVFFREAHPPQGRKVELRFVLPGTRTEIAARGEVIHVDRTETGFGARVRFTSLPLEQELAIARFLDRA
jgi:uncharacterized protein (TIGR02266 family)